MDEVWTTVKAVAGSDLDPVILPREAADTPTVGLADISAAAAVGWRPKTVFIDGVRAQYEYLTKEFADGKVRIAKK
jgi:nucleoside-diphosphate-sugar epimerase